jgi:hypothetical protein
MFGNFSRSKPPGDFIIGDVEVWENELCVPLRMNHVPVQQTRGVNWFRDVPKRKRFGNKNTKRPIN